MTPRERYHNDVYFHALVSMMMAHIESGQYTPTEIREAALLAYIIYNEERVGIVTLPFELKAWLDGEASQPVSAGERAAGD